jgi:hypothetical protein
MIVYFIKRNRQIKSGYMMHRILLNRFFSHSIKKQYFPKSEKIFTEMIKEGRKKLEERK